MASDSLSCEGSEDVWLTCELDGEAIGFCHAAQEELTDDTWNMLAIAVLPSMQGSGVGGANVAKLEASLKE